MLYRRRCLIAVVIVSIIFAGAAYGIVSAHSNKNSYEKPLTGDQVVKAIDNFFGREVKSLDWDAVIVEKSGKKTWILSDLRVIRLSPSEAFGEGNDYYYYSEIKGLNVNVVFPEEIERISICWSRQNVVDGNTDISYNVYDADVDGEWDKALVLPVNHRTREYGSDKLNLSGSNITAKRVEYKYFLEYIF